MWATCNKPSIRRYLIAALVVFALLVGWFARHEWYHGRHHASAAIPITVADKTELVPHSIAIREAGRQLKEEISKLPDAPINGRTNEAQVLIVVGRLMKENAELKAENARLKAAHGETTSAFLLGK